MSASTSQNSDVRPSNTRSKLGLDDPRVHQCRDRGNCCYNVEPSRDPLSHIGNTASLEYLEVREQVRKELKAAKQTPAGAAARDFFVPRSKLRRILTAERVVCIINSLPDHQTLSTDEKDAFIRGVLQGGNDWCKRPCVNLLATLLRCSLLHLFHGLVKDGVTDSCLPPGQDDDGSLTCQRCATSHVVLHGNTNSEEQKRKFYIWAYALNAPYFTSPNKGKCQHFHYMLNKDDVIPIIEVSDATSGGTSKQKSTHSVHEGNPASGYGGSSHVRRVRFHADHIDIIPSQNEFFAVKELFSADLESFNQELASLLTWIEDDKNQHLIKLLFSYEILGNSPRFFLVFPWADGDLWHFWKVHDAVEKRIHLSRWMADQCYNLASALMYVHNQRDQHMFSFPSISSDQHDLYGRHGDIKAENVLWFTKTNILVLADFGLGRLHTKISRSNQDPKTLGGTATYRAPEFDITKGKVSRASDVFALGCMFLEFVTWYLEGYESVDKQFSEHRLERDIYDINSDTFFRINEDASGARIPVIKPQVKDWVERLKRHPNCTYYIRDFLELIEVKMLDPFSQNRYNSCAVANRLDYLRQRLKELPSYGKTLALGT